MSEFISHRGDDGTTGLLGEGRIDKFDLRMETIGSVDEISSALGMARASVQTEGSAALILHIQRDLYGMMSELSATPENIERFRVISVGNVSWLEEQVERIRLQIVIPPQFIIPGDCLAGAHLDLARTVARRAERRLAELTRKGQVDNLQLLCYLNRLSSLCFVMEIQENSMISKGTPTLAKRA